MEATKTEPRIKAAIIDRADGGADEAAPPVDRSFAGAAVLVTGGSGWLGRLVAEAVARRGASVALTYRRGDVRAKAAVDSITAGGARAIALPLDHTKPTHVTTAIETTAHFLGGLDILVNCAGATEGRVRVPTGDLDALTPTLWDDLMKVNLRGPYLVARAAAPYLRQSRWGRIVMVGASIAPDGKAGAAAYAPSRLAVAELTRFLAAALAPAIQVNCVAPDMTDVTPLPAVEPAPATLGAARAMISAEGRRLDKLRPLPPALKARLDDIVLQIVTTCLDESLTGEVIEMGGRRR
ncbi:SDR family NAD(P)-dependent oxidoreductase [Acuticoccus sp. I52.16.1]|uniref:SDR family NAD(P)-dependent oxidoreductase n=1 Tax=Acuticoccus sp. I52.16.1 TaxID=2928472 RepID=UPI001FCFE8D6|nr:SDR family NAD(P)-dependent oxidoreductase [Acuticoccus sp. I52.16.1]UOM33668.1 SDR family NAD(P)-dependent oxidoreductase [Acuticoccus sp. I52.16.1]